MYIYLPETKWKSVEFEALIGPLSHGGYPPSSPVEKSETGHPWRLDDDWGWWLGQLHTHDGSMVLVYMLTKMGYIDGKCYHIWQHHGSYGILIIIILDYSMAKGSVKTMGPGWFRNTWPTHVPTVQGDLGLNECDSDKSVELGHLECDHFWIFLMVVESGENKLQVLISTMFSFSKTSFLERPDGFWRHSKTLPRPTTWPAPYPSTHQLTENLVSMKKNSGKTWNPMDSNGFTTSFTPWNCP